MKGFIGVIILLLFIALPAFSGERIDLTKGQIDFISKLQNQGLLSIKLNLNKVFIDPVFWRNIKYSLKEDFAVMMAIYCGNKQGSQLYWVIIYDLYSGKKLSKYSRAWGFKVY
jgi:hypothetical protein